MNKNIVRLDVDTIGDQEHPISAAQMKSLDAFFKKRRKHPSILSPDASIDDIGFIGDPSCILTEKEKKYFSTIMPKRKRDLV